MVAELGFSKRDKVLIVIGLVVVAILLIVLLVVVRGVSRAKDDAKKAAEASRTATAETVLISPGTSQTTTATSISTKTVVATPTAAQTEDPNKDLNSVKAVAANFLDAYIDRDLAQGKPYMTDGFYNSYDQAGFAGVSSPSRDRYEIVNAEVVKLGYVYKAKAYLYFKLNGADSGTSVLILDVVKDGTKFLVSGMSESGM